MPPSEPRGQFWTFRIYSTASTAILFIWWTASKPWERWSALEALTSSMYTRRSIWPAMYRFINAVSLFFRFRWRRDVCSVMWVSWRHRCMGSRKTLPLICERRIPELSSKILRYRRRFNYSSLLLSFCKMRAKRPEISPQIFLRWWKIHPTIIFSLRRRSAGALLAGCIHLPVR